MLYSEDNTDNEQEDLPYDEDLQHRGQFSYDSHNLEEFISVEHVSPTVSTLTSSISSLTKEDSDCKKQLSQTKINMALLTQRNDIEFTMSTGKEVHIGGFTNSGRNEEFSSSKMSDVLLRHFPAEDLTYQLIDSETIPEISFTDSFDETVLIKNKISENTGIFSSEEEIKNSERKVSCNSVLKNWNLTQDKLSLTDNDDLVCNSKYYNMNDSQLLIQKEPGINVNLNYTSTRKEYQNQQYFLNNTENFPNPQCNEYQVYYRLQDSSEISPKVRELKGNNESFVFLESNTIRNQEEENGPFELDQQLESKNITSSLPLVDTVRQPSVNTPFLQNITDDTEQILKKQTEELKANVMPNIYSKINMELNDFIIFWTKFLQLLKEQLEQLEHNYVATKEKHYALQLQNHKRSSRTIGKFDPNRKVEGEIFKLGMFLEDIKEKIEKTFASYSSTYISSPSIRSHPSPVCSSYSVVSCPVFWQPNHMGGESPGAAVQDRPTPGEVPSRHSCLAPRRARRALPGAPSAADSGALLPGSGALTKAASTSPPGPPLILPGPHQSRAGWAELGKQAMGTRLPAKRKSLADPSLASFPRPSSPNPKGPPGEAAQGNDSVHPSADREARQRQSCFPGRRVRQREPEAACPFHPLPIPSPCISKCAGSSKRCSGTYSAGLSSEDVVQPSPCLPVHGWVGAITALGGLSRWPLRVWAGGTWEGSKARVSPAPLLGRRVRTCGSLSLALPSRMALAG
uniref:AKNA domain-containing protein n=1 Tax=Pseudonaja textilis TaxID=8673 RepID=A0A670Y514_PSETE